MHKRRRLERTAPRTARAVLLLELHRLLLLLPGQFGPLAVAAQRVVLVAQMLRQVAADGRQGVADLGHDQGQEAALAAAQGGDEGEQGVEVLLRAGLELAGFEGHARHHVDEGAGYVEDFLDLRRFGVSVDSEGETRQKRT